MFAFPVAWSALRTRPARTLFSILGIGMGVAVAIAILTLDETTVAFKLQPKIEAFAKVDLEVTPADPQLSPQEALEKLKETPGVDRVGAIIFNTVQFDTGHGMRASAQLVALDDVARTEPAFDAYRVAIGVDISSEATTGAGATEPLQCLMGGELATSSRILANDTIKLSTPRAREESAMICINGELVLNPRAPRDAPDVSRFIPDAAEFKVVGILDSYHLGKQSGGSIIIVPFSSVSKIYGEQRLNPIFWVSKSPKVSAEELKTALTPTFAYSVDRTALIGEAADERAFRNGVRVSGVLSLLLGLFVIFHTLSMSLTERVREIAILNSLGATRRQIGFAFFVEGAMISIFGALAGVGLGLLFAKVALVAGFTTLGKVGGVGIFVVRWEPIIAIASMGVLIAMFGSIFPLLKAKSIFPARVLAQRDLGRPADLFKGMNFFMFGILAVVLPLLYFFAVPVLGEQSRETARVLVLGGLLFVIFMGFLLLSPKALAWICAKVAAPFAQWRPLEGFLASRSMVEGIPRVATSCAVLALVAAALITIKGITASLRNEVSKWGQTIERKVFIASNTPFPRERVERLAKINGVVGFESLGSKIYSPFAIYGMSATDAGFVGPFVESEMGKRFTETNSIILSTPLARALKLNIGDEIPVSVPAGAPCKLRIIAISDDVGFFPPQREYGVVSEAWMKNYYCKTNETSTHVALRFDNNTSPEAVAAAVKTELADLPPPQINTGVYYRTFELKDINRDFRLFDLILFLVAGLAGIGVLNALLLAAFERRKEIGVMKAIGMTPGQLAGTVILEAIATGVVGGAFGLFVGLAFLYIVVDALARLTGLSLVTIPEFWWLWWAFIGAILISILAAAFPILRSNQFSASEAVRYE
ncbi:MAG: ABC transporter permease [Planctomycetota bacterium]